jgi:hypothetical protein
MSKQEGFPSQVKFDKLHDWAMTKKDKKRKNAQKIRVKKLSKKFAKYNERSNEN